MRRLPTFAFPLLFVAVIAEAQPPSISGTTPAAVRPGESVVLTVNGANLEDVNGLWTSFPAATTVGEGGRSANAARFQIETPAETAVGIHGIRVYGPRGTSAIRLFVVDDLPTLPRAGNNDARERAQAIETPTAVEGHVDNLKAQFFRFRAEAGSRLSFEVLARRLGSPLDPMIRLLDDAGRELAYSDDEPGLVGDARLRHEFTATGDYLLELRDVRYQGGGGHRYRLRVGDFPCIDVPVPMAVTVGSRTTVSFAGPHVEGLSPRDIEAPKTPGAIPVSARFAPDGPSGFALLDVTAGPQPTEAEPNDDREKATRIELGDGFNGRLDRDGDVDHWRFTAKKGERRRFEAITRSRGSAADLQLRLLDAAGKQLAAADDNGTGDALLDQTFPADGEYVLVVRDLHGRGGPRFGYHVAVRGPAPPFTISVPTDHLNVPAGGVGTLTVNVARTGHNGTIELEAVDLPEGMVSTPAVIGPGRNAAVLTVRSEGPVLGLSPLRVVGRATIGGATVESFADALAGVRAANGGVAYPPESLSAAMALTVTPARPFTLAVSAPEVVFGKHLAGKVKIVVKRSEGFDEEIALAVEPAKDGLPPNVGASLKPIPKGAGEIEISFNANDKAALGRFSAVLRGTLKKGDKSHAQFTPAIGVVLRKPFAARIATGELVLAKGGESKLTVALDRNPALAAPIAVTVDGLPSGVTVASTSDAAADGTVTILLRAAADAGAVEKKDVTVTASAMVGDKKLVEKSAAFTIRVE